MRLDACGGNLGPPGPEDGLVDRLLEVAVGHELPRPRTEGAPGEHASVHMPCLLYTSPSPRD
eukprot:7363986-Alexandrium_andersonii.AAC.1